MFVEDVVKGFIFVIQVKNYTEIKVYSVSAAERQKARLHQHHSKES